MNYINTHIYFKIKPIVSAYLYEVLNYRKRDISNNKEIEDLSRSLSSLIGHIIRDIRKENKIKIDKFNKKTWKVLI